MMNAQSAMAQVTLFVTGFTDSLKVHRTFPLMATNTVLATTTFKIMGGTTAAALASTFAGLATGGTLTTDAVVNFTTTGTGQTQYGACQLVSANGGGYIAFSADE